jgi:hypothetical protein
MEHFEKIKHYGLSCLASLTLRVLSRFSQVVEYSFSLSFDVDGCLGHLQFSTIINKAAMHIHFFGHSFPFLLGKHLKVGS